MVAPSPLSLAVTPLGRPYRSPNRSPRIPEDPNESALALPSTPVSAGSSLAVPHSAPFVQSARIASRPRAGTMPSVPPGLAPTQVRRTSGANSPELPVSGPPLPPSSLSSSQHFTKPRLVSRNSSADLLLSALRARSGSITLATPANGTEHAFGPTVFATNAPTPLPASGPVVPPPTVTEEQLSVRSDESACGEIRTLDYLGLNGDSPTQSLARSVRTTSSGGGAFRMSPSMSNLRDRSESVSPDGPTLSGMHASPGRARASTVSATMRPRTTSANTSAAQLLAALESASLDSNASDGLPDYATDASASEAAHPLGALRQQASPHRPRATTIGANFAELSPSQVRRRAGTMGGVGQLSPSRNAAPSAADEWPTMLTPTGPPAPLLFGQPQHEPVPSPPSQQAPPQPTRSLWIDGIDPRLGQAELGQAFAPYGPIESIQSVPERECAFVNYLNVESAIIARNDVMTRLGGRILPHLGLNSPPVRIGFGPIEPPLIAPLASGIAYPPELTGTPMLGPSPHSNGSTVQTTPTRALWIGSIAPTTTSAELLHVFSAWGPIESARVLTHKSCAFVNMERLEDAVRARKALNGREIFGPEIGPVKIGFAKVPVPTPTIPPGVTPAALGQVSGAEMVPLEHQFANGSNLHDYRSGLLLSMVADPAFAIAMPDPAMPALPTVSELQLMMRALDPQDPDVEADVAAVGDFAPNESYYTSIPPPIGQATLPDGRRPLEPVRLRELRKQLDSQTLPEPEADAICIDLLPFLGGLAADYIGNTIVQRLAEQCSMRYKLELLERVAPHLASVGCHKNGTWAAQKLIDLATTPQQIAIIMSNLRPFVPPLLLDQYGNYVVNCCLRFGSPATDMIYDAIVNRCYEIGQGRFGARSVRTCLDSPHTTRYQKKRIASAVILNALPLATNANGAILLTWLLESSELPGRYRLLAPRLAPHLSHLCTHKLAGSCLIRIVNQKADPAAAQMILDGLFEHQQGLEDVLSDSNNGVAFVTKVVTSSFLTDAQRSTLLERTATALSGLQTHGNPAYANLLSICSGGPPVVATPAASTPASTQLPFRGTPRGSPQPRSSSSNGWGSPQSQRGGSPYGPPRGLSMMGSPPPQMQHYMASPPPGYHLMSPYLGMYGPQPPHPAFAHHHLLQQQQQQRMSPQMAQAYQLGGGPVQY